MYSDPLGPARKRGKLILLNMTIQRACNVVLALFEKRYALPGLHLSFAKKGNSAKLNAVSTEAGQRGILEEMTPFYLTRSFRV